MADTPLRLSEVLHAEHEHVFASRTTPALPHPRSTTQAQEDENLRVVFKAFHAAAPQAVCFSGGGIRSATFALGVIQGLARRSRLGGFHYLSTVSGGGYIGSWLSAWIHRCGLGEVRTTLAAKAVGTKTAAESQQVDHLRSYSNYLTPRLGLLSADTWACIATVVRNVLLNWLVLVPVFAVLMLVPQLWLAWLPALAARDVTVVAGDWFGREAALWTAFAAVVLAIAYVEIDLPSGGNWRRKQRAFLTFSLVPLLVAAALLTRVWCSLVVADRTIRVLGGEFGAEHIRNAPWWAFALVGAVVHVAGWLVGWLCTVLGARLVGVRPAAPLSRRTKWVRNLVVQWAIVPLSGALGGLGLRVALRMLPADTRALACLAPPMLLVVFFLATVACVGALSRFTEEEDREWWARSGGWVLIAALAWLVVTGTSIYGPMLFQENVVRWGMTTAGGFGGIVSFIAGRSAKTASGRRPDDESSTANAGLDWAVKIGAPLFVLLVFVALASVIAGIPAWYRPAEPDVLRTHLAVLCVLIAVCVVASYGVDVNRFSLHAMYRNRLIRAYLGASRPREPLYPGGDCRDPNPFTGFDPADNLRMHELRMEHPPAFPGKPAPAPVCQRPFHVVNVALNLVKGTRLAWQKRKAASFTFTPLHAGSAVIEEKVPQTDGSTATIHGAYQDVATYNEGVMLGTALAISGAAVSPNMGYHSSPIVTLILALLNARLGWWLANPASPGSWRWKKRGPGFALRPYLAEAFGLTDDQSKYVYLSDGGHFENLGLYEVVLRRCQTIVVVDAACDPKYRFEDLGNAIRKIRIDLGIPITLDEGLPMTDAIGSQNRHWAVGTIHYDQVDADAPKGTLYYLKPVLSGDETVDVLNYRQTHPEFPHESTADQWFDEDQFETYRMLGLHTVEQWCDAVPAVTGTGAVAA